MKFCSPLSTPTPGRATFLVVLTSLKPPQPKCGTKLLRRNVKRFRGGLVLKAHRLSYQSTLGLRVIKEKSSTHGRALLIVHELARIAHEVGPVLHEEDSHTNLRELLEDSHTNLRVIPREGT